VSADRWDAVYAREGKRWGDGPGELARVAAAELRGRPHLRILDAGCGYGRDALFLARELGAVVVGVDPASEAIELARAATPPGAALEFRTCGVEDVSDGPYDVVLVSNVYHVLRPAGRAALRERVAVLVPPGGLLYVSTLAVGDPEHYGAGTPVPGDKGSFEGSTYLHFSTPATLRREFAAFAPLRVYEHAFVEPHADGEAHRHLHVIMIAQRRP
jgi:2-polyprenyl-3-methyl-5-hydroxy-6-metoxy-1,4-benzoquinol methylase